MESVMVFFFFFLCFFSASSRARELFAEEPKLPEVHLPEIHIPEVHLPKVPEELPKIPKPTLPELPKVTEELPNIPKPTLPELPKVTEELPNIPKPTLPELPKVPELTVPKLPEVHVPELPKVPEQHVPEVHVQELSQKSTPRLPKGCGMNFSQLDFSPITGVCKAPAYDMNSCCSAFSNLACKYASHVNDFSSTCPMEFLAFLNYAGKYPNGIFINRCVTGHKMCPSA